MLTSADGPLSSDLVVADLQTWKNFLPYLILPASLAASFFSVSWLIPLDTTGEAVSSALVDNEPPLIPPDEC